MQLQTPEKKTQRFKYIYIFFLANYIKHVCYSSVNGSHSLQLQLFVKMKQKECNTFLNGCKFINASVAPLFIDMHEEQQDQVATVSTNTFFDKI